MREDEGGWGGDLIYSDTSPPSHPHNAFLKKRVFQFFNWLFR